MFMYTRYDHLMFICTDINNTRAKFVTKQQVGLPLVSRIKLKVSVRTGVLKPTKRVN